MGVLKLTDWFPADVKPVHVGVYQCETGVGRHLGFYMWNGSFWEFGGSWNSVHVQRSKHKSPNQRKVWRGLAEKP